MRLEETQKMEIKEGFNNHLDGLSETLGITYHSTDDPNTIEAHMTCQKCTSQPWGYLSGGATLALAENVAGVGSMVLAPGAMVLGINVQANHVRSVSIGEEVIATATIIHKGGHLHNWQVVVRSETGMIVSSIQVTNYILMNK